MTDSGGGASGQRAKVLVSGCAYHFYHDGIADGLYAFLPLWQLAFDLSLTQVGLIIAGFEGAMATFQVPAGLLSERFGERRLLAAGTCVTAAAFMAVGLAGGFLSLMVFLLISGFASGVQHPLSSSMVSRAYHNGPRRAVLGTFNFSGDLGKMAFPALAGLALSVMSWRMLGVVFGSLGILITIGVGFYLKPVRTGGAPDKTTDPAEQVRVKGWGIEDRFGFSVLSAISTLDTAVRSGLFTLLPFFLIAKGLAPEQVGFALALAFVGGAAGKFSCGFIAERLGIIRTVLLTEALTAGGIFLILFLPLPVIFMVLPILGAALNGTSSVLYGTVADFVASRSLGRAFGLFYTFAIAGSALGPLVFGHVSDRLDVPLTFVVVGTVALLTLPLAAILRKSIARSVRS